MYGFYSYLEANPGAGPDPVFHEMSHGESFLEVLRTRFRTPGRLVSYFGVNPPVRPSGG